MSDRPSASVPRMPLNRRELLELGALSGALALTSACTPPAAPPPTAEGAAGAPATPPFELAEYTIRQLQEAMESGQRSSRAITELYLERIAALDGQGPTLRSVIETNPDALALADELDRERRERGPRGPLHGIPILLKDNLATHDRMTTTAGSLALAGSIPPADSGVARKLREAGAVLLGKANMSEWANFRSDRSSSGWSARGGQCRNPYVLDRNPCGSSSGSGAAVSANLATTAIGTETNGSIVCPSSSCGLVGLKPTVGLVSRARVIPISHTQDTAGPMTRTVTDAAILLGAIAGADPDDPTTAAAAQHALTDYTTALDAAGLQGARIGVARGFFGFDPAVDKLMEDALEVLKSQGAEIVDPVEIPHRQPMGEASFQVLLYEFKADLAAYFAGLGPGAPVTSLADVIAFNEEHRELEMPYFGQDLFHEAEKKGPLTDDAYRKALSEARRLSRQEGLDKVMDDHRLDAIMAPTGGPAWPTDLINGDHFVGGSSSPAAISGYPNITVPAGQVFGLPVGISFFGRAWSEPRLLTLAYAFEQATRHRQEPRLLPTLELALDGRRAL